MKQINPSWQPVAFKEWQLVVNALAQGEQSVILRKGGIAEGKAGFAWLHDQFFLFPSRFHQQAEQVKARPDGSLRIFPESAVGEGEIEFSVFVETIATGRISTWEEVQRLAPFHIWNEEIIHERYEWGDEPGIAYAIVKAFVLEDPWILKDRKLFGGCRSWIELPAEEAGGWECHIETSREIEASCGVPEFLL